MGRKKKEVAEEVVEEAGHLVEPEDSDRDSIYQKYAESQVKPEEEVAESAPEEVEEEEGTPVEEYVAEATPEEEPTGEPIAEESRQKEESMVPHGALKQEREKRKALQAELKELKQQVAELLESKKSPKVEEVEEDIEITDYDEAFKKLFKRNQELEREIKGIKTVTQNREEQERQRFANERQEAINRRISNVANELAEEGYPGFDRLRHEVESHLVALIDEDEENISLDNEEGWKQIYKEKIFPNYQKMFVSVDKSRKMDKKIEIKKSATVGRGGANPSPSESKEKEWTKEDYVKMRLQK